MPFPRKNRIEKTDPTGHRRRLRVEVCLLKVTNPCAKVERSAVNTDREPVPTITTINLISRTIIGNIKAVVSGKSYDRVCTEQTVDLIVSRRPKQ